MFSILNEIKDGSSKSTTRVVIASVGTSASVYVLVAITGYLSFGDNVVGNIVSQCRSFNFYNIFLHLTFQKTFHQYHRQ